MSLNATKLRPARLWRRRRGQLSSSSTVEDLEENLQEEMIRRAKVIVFSHRMTPPGRAEVPLRLASNSRIYILCAGRSGSVCLVCFYCDAAVQGWADDGVIRVVFVCSPDFLTTVEGERERPSEVTGVEERACSYISSACSSCLGQQLSTPCGPPIDATGVLGETAPEQIITMKGMDESEAMNKGGSNTQQYQRPN